MFLKLIQIELFKIFTRPRSYIGFLAILSITGIIHIAMYMDGKSYISFITSSLEQSFYFGGNLLNGNLVAYIILQTLIIHIPLLIALVTGDLVSGEANTGTIRLLLTKPLSRGTILWGKFSAGLIYTLAILIFLAITSLLVALLLFDEGDLIVLKTDELVFLKANDTLWRFGLAFLIAFLSLTVVASLSFMFSCFATNSIGPIISTMAIIILFTIIGTIDLPLFDSIRPFLFTTHMVSWRKLFDNPVDWDSILQAQYIMLAHVVAFLTISYTYFTKKDILS